MCFLVFYFMLKSVDLTFNIESLMAFIQMLTLEQDFLKYTTDENKAGGP